MGKRLISVLGLSACLLTACIPTITRVYQAPVVEGVLVDSKTGKPVAGVAVSHSHAQTAMVYTDEQGYFLLPSISEMRGTVIMVGHALAPYTVNFSSDLGNDCIRVQGSLKMLSEEVVDVGEQAVFRRDSESCLPFN